MKKLLFLLLCIFIFSNSFGQTIDSFPKSKILIEDLPQFYTEGKDTIVLLTIAQLQKLDNKTDLLELFKTLNLQCDSLNSYYLQIIDEFGRKIYIQEIQVSNLLKQVDELNSLVDNLKQQVLNKTMQLDLSNQQLDNKDKIIDGLKEDLGKANIKKVVGWSSTGVTAVTVIILSIVIGIR